MSPNFEILNRSAAYLTALSIKKMFPQAVLLRGGVTDIGFYYECSLPQLLEEALLPFLEQNIKTQAKEGVSFRLQEMTRKNAIEMFRYHKLDAQADFLEDSGEQTVQVVVIDDFFDLCDGEVVADSQEVKSLKILSVSRIDQIYRLEGVAFPDPMELKKFLKRLDGLKNCDHRQLIQDMHLYTKLPLSETEGLWLARGLDLRKRISQILEHAYRKNLYREIKTPSLLNRNFLEKTRVAKEHLYQVEGDQLLSDNKHLLHAALFQNQKVSVSQSPFRLFEIEEIFHKQSHPWGFFKKEICLADFGTIFCTKEQLAEEIISSLQFIKKILKILGFEYCCYLHPNGRKKAGTTKSWEFAVNLLDQSAKNCSIGYKVDEILSTFEGPRLEFRVKDALNREWAGPYVCVNLELPGRLALNFYDKEAKSPAQMLMVSGSSSIDRLLGLLIENNAGRLPLWLAPEQVKVIALGEKNIKFAKQVYSELAKRNVRVALDSQNLPLGARIHEAEQQRIPYLVLIGETEEKNNYITVRTLTKSTDKQKIKLEEFLDLIAEESQPPFDNEE